MNGLFVTGTGTSVGKTEVACAIVRGWRRRGVIVGVMKPAQSGVTDGELSDAERLRAASGDVDPPELVCPYSFAPALAPAVAARLAGTEISLVRLLSAVREIAARHGAVVVEGAGGILVPLTPRATFADLAVAMGLPVLVVARAGLGTVNDTALTCEALRARRLTMVGVVLNHTAPGSDPSEPHNAAEIERQTGVRVLATLPHEADLALRDGVLTSALDGLLAPP